MSRVVIDGYKEETEAPSGSALSSHRLKSRKSIDFWSAQFLIFPDTFTIFQWAHVMHFSNVVTLLTLALTGTALAAPNPLTSPAEENIGVALFARQFPNGGCVSSPLASTHLDQNKPANGQV